MVLEENNDGTDSAIRDAEQYTDHDGQANSTNIPNMLQENCGSICEAEKEAESYTQIDQQTNSADISPAKSASSDLSDVSTTDWFNTTREEMILYEKYGADYDVIVDRMGTAEKIKLREEISKVTPKDPLQLLGSSCLTPEQVAEVKPNPSILVEVCKY